MIPLARDIDADDQTFVSRITVAASSNDSRSASIASSYNDSTGDPASHLRLSLCSLKLFGRDEQLQILLDAFESVCFTKSSKMCFIHGKSGVGKSKLAEALRDSVFEKGGLFVAGKFDQLSGNAPHSALQAAFSDLCDLIRDGYPDILGSLKKKLGDDVHVLEGMIPSLKHMGLSNETQSSHIGSDDTSTTRLNAPSAYTRFKILCRTFLEATASEAHSVVIVLDDLQWADEASLGMIENLLKVKHILIVASYRDENLTDERMPLHSLLSSCQLARFPVKCSDIALGALELTSINEMVSRVTNREPEETMPLSDVIFNKTHGNAYFCLQFLELLQREGLLTLSESSTWEWDLDRIQSETNATDNVVAITTAKLEGIQPSTRLVLMYAALLGYRIRPSLLKQIFKSEKIAEGRGAHLDELWMKAGGEANVARALSIATKEGLLESAGKDELKFAHDSLQTCLLQGTILNIEDSCYNRPW